MSALLRQLLIEEEGRIPYAYRDHLGYLTIGVGHLIDVRKGGCLPEPIIDALLDYGIAEKSAQAVRIPGFEQLNEVRQAVVVSMVFQLGFEPFDGDGYLDFRRFLAAIAAADYTRAAAEMRDSKWWREDTRVRAERAARMMETGLWIPQ